MLTLDQVFQCIKEVDAILATQNDYMSKNDRQYILREANKVWAYIGTCVRPETLEAIYSKVFAVNSDD
jgi:hypothetical protein